MYAKTRSRMGGGGGVGGRLSLLTEKEHASSNCKAMMVLSAVLIFLRPSPSERRRRRQNKARPPSMRGSKGNEIAQPIRQKLLMIQYSNPLNSLALRTATCLSFHCFLAQKTVHPNTPHLPCFSLFYPLFSSSRVVNAQEISCPLAPRQIDKIPSNRHARPHNDSSASVLAFATHNSANLQQTSTMTKLGCRGSTLPLDPAPPFPSFLIPSVENGPKF